MENISRSISLQERLDLKSLEISTQIQNSNVQGQMARMLEQQLQQIDLKTTEA